MKLTAVGLLPLWAILAQTPAPQDKDAQLKAGLERAQKMLQDWPNLARYRSDNASVKAGGHQVAFMGDSITDAWGRTYGKNFASKGYLNRGISGQTTPQMLIRFRPDILVHKPKAVVILAGTNDIAGNTGPMSLEEIQGNLQSMAELAKHNGIRVILASVLPVSDDLKPQTQRRPPEKINALNTWLKAYAAKEGHIYLDYFTSMADERGLLKQPLTYDGLHPNDAGYDVMLPLAEAAIAQALK